MPSDRPSHRRETGAPKRIAVAVGVVALVGVTLTVVEQKQDPVTPVSADTAVTDTPEAPATDQASETVGTRPGSNRPARTRQPRPTPVRAEETDPKSVCRHDRVDETFTVLTYNINAAAGGLDLIATTLRATRADVVLLQEVDRFRVRSGNVDMPTYLARQLGMFAAFGSNQSTGGRGQYGTAILSRYPVVEEWNALLPHQAGREQRGLLHVVLDVDGLQLSVYGTQLDQQSKPAQAQQMTAITSIVAEDTRPKLLGGDLGSEPGAQVLMSALSVLDDAWSAGVGKGSPMTTPAVRPRSRTDYLLHRGVALEPVRADVVARRGSDHRAVRASYRLTGTVSSECS